MGQPFPAKPDDARRFWLIAISVTLFLKVLRLNSTLWERSFYPASFKVEFLYLLFNTVINLTYSSHPII
jgi:hypothetical protein